MNMIIFAAKLLKINQLRKPFFYHLGIWLIFIWELGLILFGNLADFYLGTWRKFVRRVGGFLFGELAGGTPLISAVSKYPFPRLREGSCGNE